MSAPRTIELAHGGTHLIAAMQRGGLDVFHRNARGNEPPFRVPCPPLATFLSVGGELWVAAGESPQLTRHALDDGRLLGAPHELPAASRGHLVRGLGTSLAMWIGTELQVPLAADRAGGVLAGAPIAGADLALPLSRTRALVCGRSGIALREGSSTRWSIPGGGDGRVTHGAILSDGRAAALVVERAAEHTLLVIGLRDGSLQHRIALHDIDGVHFAARRMLAVVLAARRQLVIVDLRFGRIIGEQVVERDVCTLAIDDTGQDIALRYDEPYGELVTISVDQLAALPELGSSAVRRAVIQISPHAAARATPAPQPIDPASDDSPEPAPPMVLPADTAATDESALDTAAADPRAPALRAMGCIAPRNACAAATTGETHAVLAAQRDLAIAWAALAIARGWDRGRIAHSDSSVMPFRNEVEGTVGTLCGLSADDVAEAERRVTAAEAALGQAHAGAAPRLPPLTALADEVGLSALERDLLLVIAAPSLWGEVARLYGIVANDEHRPLCDEHLVATILADRASPYDIAVALDADAALSRFGLVRIGPGTGRPFLPLSVDRIALVVLRGSPPYGELAPTIRRFDGVVRPLDQLRIRAGVAHRLVDDLARASSPLRLVVRGRIGAGRRTLLATIAAAAGRELAVIDTSAMLRDPRTRAAELRVALERAHLCGLLPCIDGIDRIPSDDVIGREQIRDVLRVHPGAVALRIAWDARPPIDPGHVLVDLPAPNGSERVTAWTASIAEAGLRVANVSELADRYAVGPGVIERVCARVAAAQPDDPAIDAAVQLDEAVRQHLESRLGTVAHRIAHLATWSQVVLPPDIQDSLTELLARIRRRRTVFEAWGFDRVMSTSRGVTALFQGGPGTGKTLVASAIANELGMDLYRVDLSRVMSKWIGETEQNLAKLFDVAEDGNAIILFDEADSLFAKRTEVRSSVDRYANIEVNYLLQRLDSFEGIAILTTNFASSIDTAFKRRLSLRLTFPFPDEDQRERLWRAHLPPEAPVAAGLDLAELAHRYRLSGGYIRNCTLRAAFLAAEEGRPLSGDHLQRAIRAEFREIGKLGDSGQLE